MRKKTYEELVEQARNVGLIFEDQTYENNKEKYKYTCQKHGTIFLTPVQVSKGGSCKYCFNERRTKTLETLQLEASKVNLTFIGPYVNTHTHAKYECSEHGELEIAPHNVALGQGCRECSKTGFKRTKPGTLYVLKCECSDSLKNFIGFGITNNIKIRLKSHKIILKKHGFTISKVEQVCLQNGADAAWLENYLKDSLSDIILHTGVYSFKREAVSSSDSERFYESLKNGVQYLLNNGVLVEQI